MDVADELEVVRKKYGKGLATSDRVSVAIPLDNLEINVYGGFANAVETRLRNLERAQQ